MQNKFIFSAFIFVLGIIFPAVAQQPESITITTYYPSPNGVWEEIRSRRLAVGNTYHEQNQHPWDEDGLFTAGEISQGTDLVVEGSVGIGTTMPEGGITFKPRSLCRRFLL